ncbi:MAG: NAD(P)H-hydrate dehydratase [Deltaproteobacteria bacterium]|nr:NAD(P)H-hydrate dehydratase [Deltaproteobacteria bacterium]
MHVTNSSESRELDRTAIEDFDLPGIVLMENAARSILREALGFWPWLAEPGCRVIVLSGPGQNGGDGLVLARLLSAMGHQVHTYIVTKDGRRPTGDAGLNLSICRKMALPITVIEDESDPLPDWSWPDLVIDAIFGTGLDKPLEGEPARVLGSAARWKASGEDLRVLAVDLPSGLCGDTGLAAPEVLPADLTVCLGTMKLGAYLQKGPELTGELRPGDIGLTPAIIKSAEPKGRILDARLAKTLVPPRPCGAHKGTFGHAVLLGGSIGKTGALELASQGALRSGCGLVTCAHPASLSGVFQGKVTEAMTFPLQDKSGELGKTACEAVLELMDKRDCLALGPGLGLGPGQKALTRELSKLIPKPMVLDADALTNLEGSLSILLDASGPRILTPHPGEAGRLLGRSAAEIEADRLGAAQQLSRLSGAVAVLKGRYTIITAPDGRYMINQSGGPILSAGGAGDVLTGLMAGLLAQGLGPFEASALAVHLHGLAGDLAERELGSVGVTIGEVASYLPAAWSFLASLSERPGF